MTRRFELHEPLNDFLKQDVNETQGRDESWQSLREIMPVESEAEAEAPAASATEALPTLEK